MINQQPLLQINMAQNRSCKAHICIATIKGKTMGLEHINRACFVYIMSSCLNHYSVCYELNTLRRMLDRVQGVE